MIRVNAYVKKSIQRVALRHRYALCPNGSGGLCGMVSSKIVEDLRRRGIRCQEKRGHFMGECSGENENYDWDDEYDHAWVDIDGEILDATADQFNKDLPEIWYPANKKCYREGLYQPTG